MVVVVVAILGLGGVALMNTTANKTDSAMMADETQADSDTIDAMAVDVMVEPNKEDAMVADDAKTSEGTSDSMMEADVMMADAGVYTDYSEAAFEAASDKKRVLFFHATWCPDCKAANAEILKMADKIPSDVVIFKTDYDTQKALKQKYGVTYQHTFVLVDAEGEAITKWNGGDFAMLLGKVQ